MTTCVHCGAATSGPQLYCPSCGRAFIPDRTAAGDPYLDTRPGAGTTTLSTTPESRNWALAAHLSAIGGLVLGGVPAFVGPLAIWLLRRDDPFVSEHARESLNFNLSMLLYAVVGTIAGVLVTLLTLGLALLALLPLLGLVAITYLVVTMLAAAAAAQGRPYRYPLALELVR